MTIVDRDLEKITIAKENSARALRNKKFLDNAERELKKAEIDLPNYAGPCSECKWSKRQLYSDKLRCTNTLVVIAQFNQKDAMQSKWLGECNEQRKVSSSWGGVVCGPDGVLFEPKEPVMGWFARLVNRLGE